MTSEVAVKRLTYVPTMHDAITGANALLAAQALPPLVWKVRSSLDSRRLDVRLPRPKQTYGSQQESHCAFSQVWHFWEVAHP